MRAAGHTTQIVAASSTARIVCPLGYEASKPAMWSPSCVCSACRVSVAFVSTSIAVPAIHAAAHTTAARRRPRRQRTSQPAPHRISDGTTDAGIVQISATPCRTGL